MALYVRDLSKTEEDQLQHWARCDDASMKHRARVVLLSSQGYRVPEIGSLLEAHPANLRKWIHRFNERGCAGLHTVHSGGPRQRFSAQQRAEIVKLSQSNPRDLGLNFSRWTLHKLAQQAARRGIVEAISHECVRQILKAARCEYRKNASGQTG
jgi:transposase